MTPGELALRADGDIVELSAMGAKGDQQRKVGKEGKGKGREATRPALEPFASLLEDPVGFLA